MLLHGWGDISASWQFVVDELRRDWRVIAPDWRGFGKSEWQGEPYFFPSYLADLDAMLDHYSPGRAVPVVGHSMGGNIVSLYAGVFPSRITHIVNLEGFGMSRTSPEEAPDRYGAWLSKLKQPQAFRGYTDRDDLVARLCDDNPRLMPDQAKFLAAHIGVENGSGGIDIAIDPVHQLNNPVLYRLEEAMACWRRITAPVLLVTGADSIITRKFFPPGSDGRERFKAYPNFKETNLADSGHNMHHDQPAAVARLIEDFVS
ncbi:MAG: alpha/beta hydrolase [Georgfuchsia sp.]